MFPTTKVNVLKTASLFVFFGGHLLPKHKQNVPSIRKCYITPHHYENNSSVKGGLCGEIQRNQMFLIVIFPFNPIQIPVHFA